MVPSFLGLVGAALCNSCFSHASRQTQDTETAAEEGNVPLSACAYVLLCGKLNIARLAEHAAAAPASGDTIGPVFRLT